MARHRVLMVSWEYPPVTYGGLGRHVHALADALAADGHDVVVLSQAAHDAAPHATEQRLRPRVVRALLPPGYPDVYTRTAGFVEGLQPRLVAAAEPALRHWRPDVVHGHDWVVADAATALAERVRCPLVMTVHATESGLYDGDLPNEFSRRRHDVERSMVRQAAAAIVCSTAMRDEVVSRLGADHRSVVMVPNGVDPSRWRSSATERAAARQRVGSTDAPLLVLVGRLEHEKGAQDAIEALSRLSGQYGDAHLALVGDGARAGDLAAQAENAGIAARVHLLGRLGDADVAAMLGAADVALVPSRYEPFGLVALEAMAAGTPVVVSDTGGLRDIVSDGTTGLVVPPGEPAALAEAVASLLGDRARRDEMGRAGAARVGTRFGWDAVAAATRRVYDSTVG